MSGHFCEDGRPNHVSPHQGAMIFHHKKTYNFLDKIYKRAKAAVLNLPSLSGNLRHFTSDMPDSTKQSRKIIRRYILIKMPYKTS